MSGKKEEEKIYATNRKAFRDYRIIESFEAGLVLLGTEVKSIRESRVNFKDSYVKIQGGEAFLVGCHISEFPMASHFNHEPERKRKLLLRRAELDSLTGKVERKGYAIVPVKLYSKRGRIKLEIALAVGKKYEDKKQEIIEKTVRREMERESRGKY